MRHSPDSLQTSSHPDAYQNNSIFNVLELPPPPSEKVLSGLATDDELRKELSRMLNSMTMQLEAFRDSYAPLQIKV